MLHVFIDTNVLLRFYAYSDDTLNEVEKLVAIQKSGGINLLNTEQIIEEHYRNRDKELSESIKKLESIASSLQIPRFADHYEEAGLLKQALKSAKDAKTNLLNKLKMELFNGNLRADKVIEDLCSSSVVLTRTDEIVGRARLRKELGNPPGKKDSLGDQINWEILLANVPEGSDLHLVSKDGDFKASVFDAVPNYFLKKEWLKSKGGNIFLYAGLAEFAKEHFPAIDLPTDAIKQSSIQKLKDSTSFAQTHDAIAELNLMVNDLNKSETISFFTIILENQQVKWIIEDEDINSFYKSLYWKNVFDISAVLDTQLTELSEKTFDIPF